MIEYVSVRTPSDAELHELKRMTRQEIGRVSQRAQMILLGLGPAAAGHAGQNRPRGPGYCQGRPDLHVLESPASPVQA